MHFTFDAQAIATAKLHLQLEKQVQETAPEKIKIKTPQRKAKYHDKTRIRLADIKAIALRDCRCADTTEMKQRLQMLGIHLDLRYTSSWVAIVWELQDQIRVIPPAQPVILTSEQMLEKARKKGAIAAWEEDEEGELFWVCITPQSERELVTSNGVSLYLSAIKKPGAATL